MTAKNHTAPACLSVVVSVFNKQGTLAGVVQKLIDSVPHLIEVIIVDDCSTDGTESVGKGPAEGHSQMHYTRHRRNAGKTATDIVRITRAEYVVSKRQWAIEATDSDPTNTRIEVLTPDDQDLGALVAQGGGKFKGQGIFAGPFTPVVLQSFKGGTAAGAVSQK